MAAAAAGAPIKKVSLHEISFGLQAVIHKIDDLEQNISIDFSIWCYMLQPGITTGAGDSLVRVKSEALQWKPEVQIFNLTEQPHLIEETFHANETNGDVYGFLNWVIVSQQRLQLQRFPFDQQFFSIQFQVLNSEYEPFPPGVRERAPRSFPDPDKKLREIWLVAESEVWQLAGSSSHISEDVDYCECHVHLMLERKSSFHLLNICTPYFFIGLTACGTYGIPMTSGDPTGRFSFMITILLTAIAFKFVTSGLVPKTSYLTLLDKYALCGFVFLNVMLLKDFIVALAIQSGQDFNVINKADIIVTSVCAVSWILIHSLLFVAARRRWLHLSWDAIRDGRSAGEQCFETDTISVHGISHAASIASTSGETTVTRDAWDAEQAHVALDSLRRRTGSTRSRVSQSSRNQALIATTAIDIPGALTHS
jgi:hypothetical protein